VPKASDVTTVIAGGLGASTFGADLYYSRLCNHLGAVLVKPDRGGFGPIDQTYEQFEARMDELSDHGRKLLVIVGHSPSSMRPAIPTSSIWS